MTVHYESERVTVHHGDCLDVLRELPDASVDAVVTDPPYGLEFMGREWDAPWKSGDGFRRSRNPADAGRDNPFGRASRTSPEYRAGIGFQAWCEQWATECLRVLKPGGHMLAFGGTRTWHRLACAIEDAGFEIRDNLAWLYGSGFPKSLDVSKALDKAAGAEREVERFPYSSNVIMRHGGDNTRPWMEAAVERGYHERPGAAPATPNAARWQGWGTALKPAYEPIVLARKPLAGTVAGNVLAHGTGALNVDGCRVEGDGGGTRCTNRDDSGFCRGHRNAGRSTAGETFHGPDSSPAGRWPANVVLDEAAAATLDKQSGERTSGLMRAGITPKGERNTYGKDAAGGYTREADTYGDSGGASRFFYTAKAGSDERPRDGTTAHPTVKPLDLMRWLVRLVTPPGGTVLEPFAGSGTTVEACLLEGFRCVAVEREADYLPLILQRIHRRVDPVAHHAATRADDDEPSLFDLFGGDAA